MDSHIVVTPVKTGVQGFYNQLNLLDSDFRRNDENDLSAIFCELTKIDEFTKDSKAVIARSEATKQSRIIGK